MITTDALKVLPQMGLDRSRVVGCAAAKCQNSFAFAGSSWPGLSRPSTSLLRHEKRGCPALRFRLGPTGGRTRVPGMTSERPSQPKRKTL